jgi:hypothetical protein
VPRLAAVAVVLAVALAGASSANASTPPRGFGSATCLRGQWVASQAETNRVLRALIPVGGFEARGRLYMIFQDGNFQYGSRSLEVRNTVGDVQMIGRARFFTLSSYTARTGQVTFGRGTSHMEYGKMTATSSKGTFTVDGPPPKTRRVPGGTAPFQCRGATLKMKLPRFATLEWVTLRRGTP